MKLNFADTLRIFLVLVLMPNVALAHTPWQSYIVYSGFLAVLLVIAYFVAPQEKRHYVALSSVVIVFGGTYLVSMELSRIIFYFVTILPIAQIVLSIVWRRSKKAAI